jgi:protein-S-isoprenylcysteine O-methyltransferase Ste14
MDDDIFRWILLAAFALLVPVGIWHRLRAQASGEKLDRRQEGWFILLTLRPIGLLRMAGLIAYLINPHWMAWSALPLPRWLRWVGVGLGVVAGLLLTWTFRTLGRNLTDTVVTRREHTLVTRGPYRWVRHPFYVSAALAFTADTLVTANAFLGGTGALLLILLVMRTRTEEANLIERFGDGYRDYMRRTGRFLPRF